jgi:hypothetical protein
MANDSKPTEPILSKWTPVTLGLSFVTGIGITLMIVGAAWGALSAEANPLIGGLVGGGALLFIAGIAAWMAVERPFTHFDDINQPKDTGHHHAVHDEHALAVVEDHSHAVAKHEGHH